MSSTAVEPAASGVPPVPERSERELGRRVAGPTALGDSPERLWRLAWTLATTDFRLRFFDSILGYAWTLLRPLFLFGVLYLVFTTLLPVGDSVPFYGVTLLVGIVSWQFLAEATSQSVRSLVARENLVRKVDFPRLAVPLATVLTALFNYVLALVPVMIFLLAAGGGITWRFIELPFLVVALFVLAFSLALSLSALFVRYRDVEPIWDVVMQAGFYLSAVIFPIEIVIQKAADVGHPWLARAVLCNPFTAILQQMRHAVVSPAQQSTTQALSWYVVIPIAIVLGLLALGYTIFSRAAPKIAEDL